MKTVKFLMFLILPAVVLSCNNGTNNKNRNNPDQNNRQNNQAKPREPRDTINQGSFMLSSKPQSEDDKDFLKEAAVGGLMEVEAGNLAQQRATNQRVKNFGSMMVKDHSKANSDLKSLAASKNIDVPSSLDNKHQHTMADLENAERSDFDKTYMKGMVKDHEEDVELFKKQSEKANDPDIKSFASKTLPVLEMHLDSAKAIEKDLK